MPRPLENIEANIYNNILDAAFHDAKQRFPKMVYSKQNPQTGAFSDGRSFDNFVGELNDLYENKGLFKEEEFYSHNPKLKNTAVASAKAVQIIYNLCVENEINNSIDRLLQEPGIAAHANENTRSELKNRVREFLGSGNITENDKKLAESIRTSFNNFNGNPGDYIYNALNYIDELNRNICERNIGPDEVLKVSAYKAGTPVKFNQQITDDLSHAFESYSEEKGDNIKAFAVYSSGKVNPLTFLQHYNENPASLTKKERAFAHDFFSGIEMKLMLQESMSRSSNGNFDWTDFTSDGHQIVSEEEKREIYSSKDKTASDLECKIIAEILSGKDVCAKSEESKGTKIHIEPQIICKDPEGFIRRIIESLKNYFTKGREKKEINAANEKYSQAAEKNKDTFEEVSFDELVGDRLSDKLNKKPAAKQNEKEKENELDEVVIGR